MNLPRTSENRQDRGFLRLLTFVDREAPPGLQFDGQLLTPGAQFDPIALPRPAVLLEYAGRVRIAPARSRYSFAALWLLWRYDFDRSEWMEVVRTASDDSWSYDFAVIAHRYLYSALPAAEARAAPVAARIRELVDAELRRVHSDARCHVLAALDAYLSNEIVKTSRKPLYLAKPMGRAYSRIGGALASETHQARAIQ